MKKITRYFRGVGEEARRVRWPDQKTLWKAVGIVLLITFVAAGTIALSDWLAIMIMRAFKNAFPSSSASASSAVAMIVNFIGGFLK
jgi:preprotein translocase SecE subunit